MAWPGKSQILGYAVANTMIAGTNAAYPSANTSNLALYGNGTPVNTGTAFTAAAGNVYGATWNTCTESTASTGYSAGGTALTSPTSAQASNTWVYACTTAISWTVTGGITAYGGLVYNTSKANVSLCYLDFLGAQTVTGSGTFTVTFAPNIAVITCT